MSFPRKIMRYAAAAVVAGLILTAGWLYMGKDTNPLPSGEENPIAGVEAISDDVLESYLENQTAGLADAPIATSYEIDANDMKDLLAEVSDDELQQYIYKYSLNKDDILTN
jgi:hypothetical protein